MALQTSGQISMGDIAREFGGAAPHAISEYYGRAEGIPKSGEIALSHFYGKSAVVKFVNTVDRTQVNIHALMGSPTIVGIYEFENMATIYAAVASGWALQTGSFPIGSTLRIINRGYIRGGGGNGGDRTGGAGGAGGHAIILNFPAIIDNTAGYIYGGGGGGAAAIAGGGGGAGMPAGRGGSGNYNGVAGGPLNGGAAGYGGALGGGPGGNGANGGALASGGGGGIGARGGAGNTGTNSVYYGGAAGAGVKTNGIPLTWLGGSAAPNVYGGVVA